MPLRIIGVSVIFLMYSIIFQLRGAVKLGFKKELDAVEDSEKKEALYNTLVAKMYEAGKATEAASHLEIDAVIDPMDTRSLILKALESL